MKAEPLLFSALFAFSLIAPLAVPQAAAATLVVNVSLKSPNDPQEGYLRVGLFDSSETWLKDGKELRGQGGAMPDAIGEEYVFDNLQPGRYAVGVYIDENDNQETDKNWFGAPTEPVGMSNNPRFFFGAPRFEESVIELGGDETVAIDITVHN